MLEGKLDKPITQEITNDFLQKVEVSKKKFIAYRFQKGKVNTNQASIGVQLKTVWQTKFQQVYRNAWAQELEAFANSLFEILDAEVVHAWRLKVDELKKIRTRLSQDLADIKASLQEHQDQFQGSSE